ncbi:spore germination protein [Effusibacillus consociatus]|uniref:Spore germination protein n=1 Tax=Effusibacillus consociatus TaxID=1117041 RepID=A0ABV9Q1F9_9BACL
MSVWAKIGRLFTVDDSIMDEDFSLVPDESANDDEQRGERNAAKVKRVKSKKRVLEKAPGKQREEAEAEPSQNQPIPDELSDRLQENRDTVETIFHLPKNADVIIRDFVISRTEPIKAFAVFLEGVSSKETINSFILQPLMLLADVPPDNEMKDRLKTVKEKLLPGNQVMEYDKWEEVKKNILSGSTAVFIDGVEKALIIETKGWEQRGVGETKTETVVRGPHDAFTENLRANTGLVRARLRTEKLITEMMQVGQLAPTDVAVMYIDGIANPKLVAEVKKRIKAVKVDFLQDSGTLEQFIEDQPVGLVPKMMATERPDRVAASLSEGFIAVFVGQSPYVLILPTMIWSLLHTAEDAFLRYPFGSLLRLIRFVSFGTALLLPAFYIAITNYHPEMIPTDLMLAIAAARERVPFPVVLEVLMMELALELIREAGIRIPNVIGPTIGIVGALILGQAAVQAGIISPLLVIVVAVTALSAFSLPNYSFSFAIRLLRFVFIFIAAIWGFYGITLGIMGLLMNWACMKSFGVPMLSPVAPFKPSSPDIVLRAPAFLQEKRPSAIRPMDTKRQRDFTRPWDPAVHDSEEAQEQSRKEQEEPDRDHVQQGGEQND